MDGCPRCSHKRYEGDIFCGHCGINLLSCQHTPGATIKELQVSDIQLSLGIVYFKKKEFEKSISTFKRILQIDKDNVQAKRFLMLAEKSIKRSEELSLSKD